MEIENRLQIWLFDSFWIGQFLNLLSVGSSCKIRGYCFISLDIVILPNTTHKTGKKKWLYTKEHLSIPFLWIKYTNELLLSYLYLAFLILVDLFLFWEPSRNGPLTNGFVIQLHMSSKLIYGGYVCSMCGHQLLLFPRATNLVHKRLCPSFNCLPLVDAKTFLCPTLGRDNHTSGCISSQTKFANVYIMLVIRGLTVVQLRNLGHRHKPHLNELIGSFYFCLASPTSCITQF